MLTETQLKLIRRITLGKSDDYCDKIRADDAFAVSEIAANKPSFISQLTRQINNATAQVDAVNAEIAKNQDDLALWQSYTT